ncbi:GNAT family N-acetyltransferase [Mesonia sp. K4-1]|jgi:predicted GNAT family acetyltransferase|uniref:GNAT family N-acetyltransferase n=1 Tax=Mesonia sp. K4-1 TaxID=2602760 RepID=UPI0011CB50B4|nr:GNAT family N-acetyltransferase [Mesonia sp. K4-1]TXK76158.1 N-acetyltransferase [Mesonia sp. K4-1]
MSQSIKHKENQTNGMFYLEDNNGILSELTYIKKDNNILVIDHTETKKGEEGKGLASKLLDHTVNYAKENNFKIDPLCPFAEVKFDENEEYQKLKA